MTIPLKITLIQPRAGRYNPSYIHEPLNLGYLAGYLRGRGIHDVRIIVSAFCENDTDIIRRSAASDVVGFTATSPMVKHALFLAEEIKKRNPQCLTVFGGAHPSVDPAGMLKNPACEAVVRGEGEATFHELVLAAAAGRPVNRAGGAGEIRGLSFRNEKGDIQHNPARPLINDLDTLPFPARDLFDQQRFLDIGYGKYGDRGAWMLSSRGCPYLCTYCASNKVWTRKWRPRSPQNIFAEIKQLREEYRIDRINFADDTFTISRERVVEFCRLMAADNPGVLWACNARVDNVDEEIFHLMKEAGCVEVWMGVESGSPGILKEIRKGLKPREVHRAFGAARSAGLLTRGYFMIGSRSESRETIGETERLIDSVRPDRLAFSIMTPYPGCEEYDLWKLRNGHAKVDWSEIDLLETEAVMVSTAFLSKDDLKSEHQRLKEKYASLWRV